MESLVIHGGIDGDAFTGAVNVPVYQTSTYRQEAVGKTHGYEYSRMGNPTRHALEKLIADLEEGSEGFAFASGMAAISAVLSLFKTGDSILLAGNVYGGTYRILNKVFDQFGIQNALVDAGDLTLLDAAFQENTRALLLESPANPLMTVVDLQAAAGVAHRHNALVIVDNTFMTPCLQKPLKLGADIVVHSATKYLGGHSDLIAGLAVVKDDTLSRRLAFIQNATGGILQPFDSFLLIRGIKTLAIRMQRHSENALLVAQNLKNHPAVKRVYYPGLQEDPGFALQSRQALSGGGMVSFDLQEGYDMEIFFSSLKMIALAESLGGVESLACYPVTMTHASIPEDILMSMGITDRLVRLSIGIEYHEDIWADIDQALKAAGRR
jgi:cystathionine beta-lyase